MAVISFCFFRIFFSLFVAEEFISKTIWIGENDCVPGSNKRQIKMRLQKSSGWDSVLCKWFMCSECVGLRKCFRMKKKKKKIFERVPLIESFE